MPQFAVYKEYKLSHQGCRTLPARCAKRFNRRARYASCGASPHGFCHERKILKTLTPTFEIEGRQYVMVTPQLAGIAKKQLGTRVAELSAQRNEIIAALDLLITGI